MNPKTLSPSPAIVALTIFAVASLPLSEQAVAQSPPSKSTTTWQDLGFNQVPEGLSNDMIPLFEGLNASRGTWSFDGELAGDGDSDGPVEILKGSLRIQGNPKAGMIPIWQMALGWPVADPGHSMLFNIMAGPSENGFDLMLIRIGPVENPGADHAKPKLLRTPFQGTWHLESKTITWTERDLRVSATLVFHDLLNLLFAQPRSVKRASSGLRVPSIPLLVDVDQ